jgi:hypothetical protein
VRNFEFLIVAVGEDGVRVLNDSSHTVVEDHVE